MLVLVAAILATPAAHAADKAVLLQGDTIVTGFSGTKAPDGAPANPLDETVIDLDGPSAQIRTFGSLAAPPTGQLVEAPPILKVPARDIGQVFAIALDVGAGVGITQAPPNIYLGATSAFGLQIVTPDSDGDGRPERVKTGQPSAQWMAGQFGLDKGGGPGSIWKVDGVTGAVSLFATIPGNSGPGIGDIVFDPSTRQFFVSDLDTGVIHRLDAAGVPIDTFDHGTAGRAAAGLAPIADDGVVADIKNPAFKSEDSATWGFTPRERGVWGLGIRAGRLYYADRDGPAIWSLSINLDGTFGSDPRREIEVSGTPNNHPISDIAFDHADLMYVAQRGGIEGSYDYSVFADAKQSVVFRFKREIPDDPATPGIWVPVPDEHAIGFPPDHRNTSGGLALGLKHEPSGAFRYGACDQMLWATGDSLRDSPVTMPELAAGGPAIVHGLQGSDRALVRPDNEPPLKSYFVDYDGEFDDPEKQGHVGDVEIWQPCDGKVDFGYYVPLPYLPPGYVPPTYTPPGGGVPTYGFNLRLDKEAVPGACALGGLGVLCDYVVRVTNTGPDLYVGPVVVNDKLPAAPAGAVMTFANTPPWLCVAISPTEHQCTADPTVLWPGDSIDLFVTVDMPVAAPTCHLDNAAALVWPLGFGDANPADDFDFATATIPAAHCPPPAGEKTNLKIEKFAFKPICSDEPGGYKCHYGVAVRNVGPGVYSGPIKVDEIVPAGATATFAASPKWSCSAAPPYSCEHEPVVLNPNQARGFGVWMTVPKALAPGLACKATNKAKIVEAAGGTDHNTDPTDDEAEATALLPGELAECPGLPPLSNLVIEKTRAGGIECPVFGGHWICEFIIKVTNKFNDYTSPIQFLDALPFGTPAGTKVEFQPPAGWNCGGPVLFPTLYQCGSNNPNLKHQESVDIPVTVKVPLGPVAQCYVKNTAQIIKAPGGTPLNFNAGDDLSWAAMKFKKDVIVPDTGEMVCLSPAMGEPEPPLTTPPGGKETNLSITKTAGPSSETPTGQNTTFTITVTNIGPGVFNGPIEVLDTLFDGQTVEPSNGSWSDPWVCEGQSDSGHPEQGLCTHPVTELDPGESVVLTLGIEAPNSFVAPSGSQAKCGYTNTVEILDPPGGTPQNTNAGDDSASAEVHFEPYEKHGQTFCEPGLTTPPPPPPSCPQGWSRTPVPGKCCPPRTGWDGKRCTRGEPPPKEECPANSVGDYPDCRCKSGYTGRPPNCRKVGEPEVCNRTARCLNGRVWSRDACACVCPPDKPWNPALWRCGSIIVDPPRCPDGQVRIGGLCRCPVGTRWIDGKCRAPPSDPPKTCGPNAVGKYPDCRCERGYVGTPPNCRKEQVCESNKEWIDGGCRCRYPLKWDGKRCVEEETKQCPADSVGRFPNCRCKPGTSGAPGNCKPVDCPSGRRKSSTGECVPDSTPPKTCPADSTGRPPNCRCKPGTKGTPGNCTPVVIDPPRQCPSDSVGRFPNCRCKPGTKGTPGNCAPIVVDPPKVCPPNSVGKFPNCRCKPGTKGTPPNCVRVVVTPPVLTLRCPANSVGKFPNCRCRPGFAGKPPNCKAIKVPSRPPKITVPRKADVKPLLKVPAPKRLSSPPSRLAR